jgi:hypothetical protein
MNELFELNLNRMLIIHRIMIYSWAAYQEVSSFDMYAN